MNRNWLIILSILAIILLVFPYLGVGKTKRPLPAEYDEPVFKEPLTQPDEPAEKPSIKPKNNNLREIEDF